MEEKKFGVTVLVFEIREAKGHFKGCYVSVAIATNSVVLKITEFKSRNINLSLVTSICQMKFKDAKSESIKLPETQIVKNCMGSVVRCLLSRGT